MVNFMKKIPGGLLLVPMFVSALINTIFPNAFSRIGGVSNAFFGPPAVAFCVGMISFVSATMLNLNSISKIIKKEGVLYLVKILICIGFAFLLFYFFGEKGFLGISTMAIIIAFCSTNPALFLALISDYGEEGEEVAFGLAGIICIPAFPMLVYSLSKQTQIDWMPVISILIPIIAGMVLGNLDKGFKEFCAPAISILTPFFGFSLGSSINLLAALQNGISGLVLTALFYLCILSVLYFVERIILRSNGIASIAVTSVAGLSVAVPSMIAALDHSVKTFAETATAQIAFATLLTSIITPILVSLQAKASGIKKRK